MHLKNKIRVIKAGFGMIRRRLMSPFVQSRCLLCKGCASLAMPLCSYCLGCLPRLSAPCLQCALPMPYSRAELCAQCLKKRPSFDCCLSAFLYSYPMNHVIKNIKYGQHLELIEPITHPLVEVLMRHYLEKSWPEAIIPIPLHKKKIRVRGFNQSLLLAKVITSLLPEDIPCLLRPGIVTKHRDTLSQQSLPARARHKNIKGAFTVEKNICYKHVAIIDDVVTTAETANEVSKELKRNGIQQVDIWCLARTP